jgi:hypothetical protein
MIMKVKLYFIVLFSMGMAACNNKSETMSGEEKLAGKDEKTWEAKKETDASGDKDKLTREEKKERITFWRDGNVRMGDDNSSQSGKWTLQGTNLSLVFSGSDVSENFTVIALDDDELKLRAGDGSEMIMEPE